ncbi:MAG: thioredoxin domain-containing protein, partial [Alphaproteobacteria bacterium]|nr:thioredoxin domain-containing protein [Alphaproteobacteria bacterium]
SVGYAACHWCHVMAHESFDDETTAALMNAHFVCVKLDREERPDIDAAYQTALALIGKQGGWPLTMFLAPDGRPFWGGTYFPPEARHGLPAFRDILSAVAGSWKKDADKIAHNVQSLMAALEEQNAPQKGALLPRAALDNIARHYLSLIDPAHGGIGGAGGGGPKFPNLTILNFLWNAHLRTGDPACRAAVIHSLTQMCQGGIYDHLGGGFSRYSVDAEWLVPHFEKMLCDNALFLSLLTEVYKETQNPLFKSRIFETVEFVLRDLRIDDVFAASLDADSGGSEGKYYVWTAKEIDDVLDKDSGTFKKAYDVTAFGNWEQTNILNRLRHTIFDAEEEAILKPLRDKLKTVRDRRVPPARDGKILADNNGLMIAALASAGFALEQKEWVAAAEKAFAKLAQDELVHTGKHAALLEDYAGMCAAALALYGVTRDRNYVAWAEKWVGVLDEEFWDKAGGGYFMSASGQTDNPVRVKSAQDHAAPSGNGTLVSVLAQLAALAGEEKYGRRARATAEAFAGDVAQRFFPYATLLGGGDLLQNPATLTLSGDFDAVLRKISWPALVKIFENGEKPEALLCLGDRCLAPARTPDALENLLRDARAGTPAANDG